MKVCGKTICNTVVAKRVGPTDLYILVNIWQERSTEGVFTVGTTAANMMASGMKTKLRALEPTLG